MSGETERALPLDIPDAIAEVPIIDPDTQIGIYVHIPFCQKHCPYCDFAVVEGMLHIAPAYVDALCAEIRQGAERYAPNPPVATIFLGGGTPSLLPAAQIGRILDTIGEVFAVQPGAEITLEANPGPLRPRHLAGFRAAGVTRLSIGVQTFNPRGLDALGRLHTSAESKQAIMHARAAGFASVSADLIFGWQGQTLADWRDDLQTAIALHPDHLSAYSLTVEEGTPLAHAVAAGTTSVADEDLYADMFLAAEELLTGAGYCHYETSNYARPGHRSRHNCGYWVNGDYLGFGVGAHSHRRDRRFWNARDLHTYLKNVQDGNAEVDSETISEAIARAETMFLGTRLAEGIAESAFADRHGYAVDAIYGRQIAEYVTRGVVTRIGGRIALAPEARLLADEIAVRFLEGEDQ
jgi:oxygen-independent coproporphyrinogen-3 oxidase